jgi:hypothetical protein
MKTLRLNRAESTAYTNGERRFWRAMRKQPDASGSNGGKLRGVVWNDVFDQWDAQYFGDHPRLVGKCPYGKPDDRIGLKLRDYHPQPIQNHPYAYTCATITRVTVEQRGGRWGWVVEVGNE